MQTLQTLRTNLQQRLRGASRIALLGIGSELRADDVAGILIAQRVQELAGKSEIRISKSETNRNDQNSKSQTEAELAPRFDPSDFGFVSDFGRDARPVQLAIFLGGTAPENLTGEIKRFHPTHLVIVDAADLDSEPGAITIMDPDSIGGTTFCTHSLPIKVMIDYLLESFERDPKRDPSRLGTQCHVTVIGVQPQSLEVGVPVSKEVLDAVESLSALLLETLPRP